MSVDFSHAPASQNVAVIGLGRFGGAVAESLIRMGHEVFGIDGNPEIVQDWSDRLTHIVQADTTNVATLRRLGLQDFHHVVVGIGSDLEASVLTTLALSELEIGDIWAKAVTLNHGRILERTGAHHVIYPEVVMGERVAHLVTSAMLDFIEFDDGYAIVQLRAPSATWGQTLQSLGLRAKHGITVVGIKRPRQDFMNAQPEMRIEQGDILIVSGATGQVERFAAVK